MKPLETVSGAAVPLMRENVDTDVIIRIERLGELPRDALGPYAFEAWRFDAGGTEIADCALNDPAWKNAPILLAGANFGCGSSREGAVWALQCLGIRCVVAPSFGGIFANNCFQNGVLPVTLPAETVERLAAIASADPSAPITVDLVRQCVIPPNGEPIPFAIDRIRREALLTGQDELGLTLARRAEIAAFESADRERRPWIHTGLSATSA